MKVLYTTIENYLYYNLYVMSIIAKKANPAEIDTPTTWKVSLYVDCNDWKIKIKDDSWCVNTLVYKDEFNSPAYIDFMVVGWWGSWWYSDTNDNSFASSWWWWGWWVLECYWYLACAWQSYNVVVWVWWCHWTTHANWCWWASCFWDFRASWWQWWVAMNLRWQNCSCNADWWNWWSIWCWNTTFLSGKSWGIWQKNWTWWWGWGSLYVAWWNSYYNCWMNWWNEWGWWIYSDFDWTYKPYWWWGWGSIYTTTSAAHPWAWWWWWWAYYQWGNTDATWCWGWWWWENLRCCASGIWWNWVVYVRYKEWWASWILCATWWTITCCNWYIIHTFTENWTFSITCSQPFNPMN